MSPFCWQRILTGIKRGKGGQTLYDRRVPRRFLPQPLAGKIRTQSAKRNTVLYAAKKDRAAARLLPFLTFPAAFQGSLGKNRPAFSGSRRSILRKV